MEKLQFEIVDPRWAQGPSAFGSAHLAAIIGADGISNAIFNEQNELLNLRVWHFDAPAVHFDDFRQRLTSVFQTDETFRTSFSSVKIGVSNAWASLVPDRFFDPERLPTYLKLLMQESDRFVFGHDPLPEGRMVWAAEKDLLAFVRSFLPNAAFFHVGSRLVSAWKKLASPYGPENYINVRGRSLQIAVFDRAELLFFNTFSYQNAQDFLYFSLLAFEQFKLDPSKTPLFLSGELVADSEIYRQLYRFIADIRFVPRPDRFVFPASAFTLPGHLNFDLFAL